MVFKVKEKLTGKTLSSSYKNNRRGIVKLATMIPGKVALSQDIKKIYINIRLTHE